MGSKLHLREVGGESIAAKYDGADTERKIEPKEDYLTVDNVKVKREPYILEKCKLDAANPNNRLKQSIRDEALCARTYSCEKCGWNEDEEKRRIAEGRKKLKENGGKR